MFKLIPAITAILVLTTASACVAKPNIAQESAKQSTFSSQTYIKPGAGIGYAYDLKPQYNIGETVNLRLRLGESYQRGLMRVNVNADGLKMLESASVADFDMSASEGHEMTMSFTASTNGRHYINVQALADIGNGNPMTRVFSIPVQVGPVVAQKPHPNMKTTPNGENIIEMTAEEDIK